MKAGTKIQDVRSAASQAELDYRAHGCKDFEAHLRDHLATGYVFSTPHIFAMFKAVALEDNRTAWYVTYARGDFRILLALVPFPLPYIAFRSRDRAMARVWPFDRFCRLASRLPTTVP